MKTLLSVILGLLVLGTVFGGIQAMEAEAPKVVEQAFAEKYPGESKPDWRKDKNGNYEAHFKKDGVHYRADFTPEGSWIETETNVEKSDLPKAIKKVLSEAYDDYKIVEIELVSHNSKGEFYDVELKKDGKKQDIEFREDGSTLN